MATLTVGFGEAFETIQAAIDAANPGDEIVVTAGTYREQLVIIGKDGLTITAEPGTFIESPNDADLVAQGQSYALVYITSDNVTISGFIIDGRNLAATDDADDSFGAVLFQGVTGGAVTGSFIINFSEDVTNGLGFGVLLVESTGVTVTGNVMRGSNIANVSDYGVAVSGGGGHTIANNDFSRYTSGIDEFGITTPDLVDNTSANRNTYTNIDFQNHYVDAETLTTDASYSGSEGLDVYLLGSGNDTIAGNGGDDFLAGRGGNDAIDGGGGTDVALYFGSVSGYSYTAVTDATGRVTGFSSVTDTDAVNGDEGADTLSGVEVLEFDGLVLDTGQAVQLFDAGGVLVGTFDTIQAGVDAASDGFTLRIAAGTFTENVDFNKAVTVLGAQADVAATGRDAANGVGETTLVGRHDISEADGAVVLNGLRFLNNSTTTGGGASDATLHVRTGAGHDVTNNIFFSTVAGGANGVDDRAIMLSPIASGEVSITGNYITGSSIGAFGTASWGRGIWTDGGGVAVTIDGNRIEFTRTGVNLDISGTSTVAVTDNEFITNGSGISVGINDDGLTATDNDFTNVGTEFNLRNVSGGVTFDAETAVDAFTGDLVVVLGGNGADDLSGTSNADVLDGNNLSASATDADTLSGRGGNDTLLGKGGDDTLNGGDGSDSLNGGAGNDTLNGDGGTDTALYGGPASDYTIGTTTDASGLVTGFTSVTDDNGATNGDDGADTLSSIEQLSFAGGNVIDLADKVQLFDADGDLVGTFDTLQAAEDAASANFTIVAAAGEFAENLVIDVAGLTLRGANANVDPNTGVRGAESVIRPGASGAADGNIITVRADGVTIDGFKLDGFNTALAGGVAMNGGSTHAARAIGNGTDGTGFFNVDNLTVVNNDISNVQRFGVVLFNGSGGPVTGGNLVDSNFFHDIAGLNTGGGLRTGVFMGNEAYVDVTNNRMVDVGQGVETRSLGSGDPDGSATIISNNEISAQRGLFINNHFGAGSNVQVIGNTITLGASAVQANSNGIRIWSIFNGATVVVEDNDVSGAFYGYRLWNNAPGLTIEGGTLTGNTYGLSAYDTGTGFNNVAGDNIYVLEGVNFADSAIAHIIIEDTPPAANGGNAEITVRFDATTPPILGTAPTDVQINGVDGRFEANGFDGNLVIVGDAAGNTLDGGDGDDSITPNAGNDTVTGGAGNDVVNVNVTTDGADTVDLGAGSDVVLVAGDPGQVRLTFLSAGVGNGNPIDPVAPPGAGDGLLNVRFQAEDGADGLTNGVVSRYDDEGITFVAGAGQTFDVRDTGGAARGDQFEVVTLGTSGSDTLTAVSDARPYYFNAGMGDDDVTGGSANDFLVGGGGNDALRGAAGTDTFLGGAGNDTLTGGAGDDALVGGAGNDTATFSGAITSIAQIADADPTAAGNQAGFSVTSADGTDTLQGVEILQVEGEAARTLLVGAGGFATIQAAIDAALDGDTILVYAGTYTEQLDIEDFTGLTLEAQGAVTILAPAALALNADDPRNAPGDGLRAVVSIENSTGIVFRGFTVDGNFAADTTPGTNSGDVLGVAVFGSDATLDGITVRRTGADPDGPLFGVQAGHALHIIGNSGAAGLPRATVTVTDSVFEQFQKTGVIARYADLTFTGNTITGNGAEDGLAQNGLQISYSTGLIDGNTITGIGYNGPAAGTYSSGIIAFGNSDLDITGNTITGAQGGDDSGRVFGIYIDDFGAAANANSGGSITGNTISEVDNAISVYGALTPDSIAITDNIVTDIDAADPEVGGLVFAPTPGTVAHDIEGTEVDDAFSGGSGDDIFAGLGGDDLLAFDITNGGADSVDLGSGDDTVQLSGDAGQIRVTFTSATVGNDNPNDTDGFGNVRLQAETGYGGDNPQGPVSRFDDEGITFVAGAGQTFDVRVLVSGAERGDQFGEVQLGTAADDVIVAGAVVANDVNYYVNAGGGNDDVTGGSGDDFLVGGGGTDTLKGLAGSDSFIGGGGSDSIDGGDGIDTAIYTAGTIARDANGQWTVTDAGGTDTLANVERVVIGTQTFLLVDDTPGNGFETIQAAVDAASDGATILVAAGTYVENVDFNKAVTVRGAQSGVAATSRDAIGGANETTLIGSHDISESDGAVVLDGLRFVNDSTTTGGGSSDPTLHVRTGTGHSLTNNIFFSTVAGGANGVDDHAIFLSPIASGDVSITGNYITGSFTGAFGTASWGRGIWTDGGGVAVTIDGNRVEFTRSGLNLDLGGDTTVLVSNNEFITDGTAISVGVDTDGLTVTDNDFTDVGTEFNFRNVPGNVTFDAETAVDAFTGDFVVVLGGNGADNLSGTSNADVLDGNGLNVNGADADILLGRGGNDTLFGRGGDDTLTGGAGNDTVTGGAGNDVVNVNVTTDGADTVDLGAGSDVVLVAGDPGQVRLTFLSAGVGNGNPLDPIAPPGAGDGLLNVRFQAEDGADGLTNGVVSRYDDEGITFVAGAGQTFDVRDTGGAARGDQFEVVTLGTSGSDTLTAVSDARPYYFNAGMGDDDVTGGSANDFLVGGGGNDALKGAGGTDTFLGGAGNDTLTGGTGNDTLDGGAGNDTATYAGPASGYAFVATTNANGQVTGFSSVSDTDTSNGDEGSDTLTSVEAITFDGVTLDAGQGVQVFDEDGALVGTFATIQDGIDAASDGFSILVGAGTYTEQLDIEDFDGLTIEAVGAVTILSPADRQFNSVDPVSGDQLRSIVSIENSSDIVIRGFVVDGNFAGDTTPGSNSGDMVGIAVFESGVTFDGLTVQKTGASPSGPFGVQAGDALFVRGTDGTVGAIRPTVIVTDSTFTDFQKTGAVILDVDLTFTGNTIVGIGATGLTAQNGLQIGGVTGIVSANTFSDLGYDSPFPNDETYSTAIIAYEPAGPLTIDGNTITGTGTAGSTTAIDLSDTLGIAVQINNNVISDVDYGIYAYSFTGGTVGLDTDPSLVGNSFTNILIQGIRLDPEESFLAPFTTNTAFNETGTNFADRLAGSNGNDVFVGGAGNDILLGRGGNDTLTGGTGDDTYGVDQTGDVIVEAANSGTDTVITTLTRYQLLANFENLTGANAAGQVLIGTALNNVMIGAGGNDRLFTGSGNDTASGNGGNDQLFGELGDDILSGGAGNDLLEGNAGTDVLTGDAGDDVLNGGDGDDSLSGSAGNDSLLGAAGSDTLDGGTGADIMKGAAGADTYFVDNVMDQVLEEVVDGGTIDTVNASIANYTLGANLENITHTGTIAIDYRGNALDNVLNGGTSSAATLLGFGGNDTLIGAAGNDRLYGGDGNDTLTGSAGADLLVGEGGNDIVAGGAGIDNVQGNGGDDTVSGGDDNDNVNGGDGNDFVNGDAGNDSIVGGNGNDTLDGGTGNDLMVGNMGDDTYIVDSVFDGLIEQAGQGTDTVSTTLTAYTLGTNFENFIYTGTAAVNAAGNAVANVMTAATASSAVLSGFGGDDQLNGSGGNDNLFGGIGNDILNGMGGNDVLLGEDGADTIDGGIGNDNLQGGAGADTLNGGAGTDNLSGGLDNDILNGGDEADSLSGNEGDDSVNGDGGNDLVFGNDGNDTLTGGAGEDRLAGGAGNDSLSGGDDFDILNGEAGDDTIDAGGGDDRIFDSLGIDMLTGGLGADDFRFTSSANATGDTVTDFDSGSDKLNFQLFDGNPGMAGTQNPNFTFIGATAFNTDGTAKLRFDAGQLQGDVDGDGVVDFTITIGGDAPIGTDFLL